MPLPLFNDRLDEDPEKEVSEGFKGTDAAAKPTLLPLDMARRGENVWIDVDGLIQTRPGLRFNSLNATTTATADNTRVQGAAYFDTAALERILVVCQGTLREILTAGNNATTNALGAAVVSTSAAVTFAQLVDRMFYTEGTIRWAYHTGVWSFGSVPTFSDATAMPTWRTIVAHGFRLLAVDADGIKIYASAIGNAEAAANWVKTDNIRVGTGEGDPVVRLVSGQSGYLVALTERAAYQIDTSSATVANWTVRKITGLTGCVEGKTAVEIGQDIIFLSRYGVVSLGALANTDSLNASSTLSAPMQPYIDRINWSAISKAWGTTWRDLYILAVPVDSDTYPTLMLTFNTRTRRWSTPWKCTLPNADLGGGNTGTFAGWGAAVVPRFSTKQETLIADTTGRVHRLDDVYEKDDRTASTTQEITSWITLRSQVFGADEALKQPFWVEIDWYNSTASSVQVNLVRDGLKAYPDKAIGDCEIIATGLSTNNLTSFPIIFPLVFQANETYSKAWVIRQFSRFREAALQIVAQQGRMRLRMVKMAAFVDTPTLVR